MECNNIVKKNYNWSNVRNDTLPSNKSKYHLIWIKEILTQMIENINVGQFHLQTRKFGFELLLINLIQMIYYASNLEILMIFNVLAIWSAILWKMISLHFLFIRHIFRRFIHSLKNKNKKNKQLFITFHDTSTYNKLKILVTVFHLKT